jgi:ATP-binding cassette subfamily C (CFTR/MRP) protein 1
LLFASFSAFKWQFISAICPRICLIGFTFAQPFLINRLIEIVSEEMTEESKRDGYGMIGAAVVIYVGMAVSSLAINGC